MPKHFKVSIKSKEAPVVHLTGEGSSVYVMFQAGKPVAKTIHKNDWPLLNIDLDKEGSVVGVEAAGMSEFTIHHILAKAGVAAAKSLLSRTRYTTQPVEQSQGMLASALRTP